MKKVIIRGSILFLIGILIFMIIRFVILKEYNFENISYEEFIQLKTDEELNIVYITGNDYFLEEYEEILIKILNKKKINIKKLDITDVNILTKLINDQEFKNYFSNEFIFPNLIILKDGKIIENITYSSEEEISNHLKQIEME